MQNQIVSLNTNLYIYNPGRIYLLKKKLNRLCKFEKTNIILLYVYILYYIS
jgi:hypothetical protein